MINNAYYQVLFVRDNAKLNTAILLFSLHADQAHIKNIRVVLFQVV